MRVGYARTSTAEQQAGFDAQLRELEAAGCEKVFREQVSSVVRREQLDAALDFIREGDVLVVTRLDRLARSTGDLLRIADRVKAKSVALSVLNMPMLDTTTATGALVFTVIGAIAEFERKLMLERQREGIAAAKAQGKYKGRVPTARRQSAKVLAMQADGIRPVEIMEALRISKASFYRIIKQAA